MTTQLALIGFGEAGRTFAGAAHWAAEAQVFDIKTDDSTTSAAMREHYARLGVTGCETLAQALAGAPIVLSLVTADQTPSVAQAAAAHIAPGTLFCDMNSVSPGTKRANAAIIEAAGGRYGDIAVMAPVQPAALAVPLLVSGPHAQAVAAGLHGIGFANVTIVGDAIGDASATKMVRSVMVKGIEALTAEMMLAANRAGVTDGVLASLGGDWPKRADYNLDRMLAHGARRAAEMEEVAKTLVELGISPLMTRGTITRQRTLGSVMTQTNTPQVPEGLAAKTALIQTGMDALIDDETEKATSA